jgi:tetratricopeptide (TPR) repeat protein
MDEDLLKEGTSMLRESQKKLLLMINPLLSKARSFKEGQDLKQAYETYGEVLKYDPANEEALNERDNIFETLKNRSKKIYRDALVAESLSLYGKAKEKFQEVQQISPINSEYYNKASDTHKNYLE